MRYEKIIIGAGLAGLAAGIRLSHYDKKVLIIESHSIAGGLNSYYQRGKRNIDVGLHAMTNFYPTGSRGTPLTKLFRQLRIKQSEFELVEQKTSSIVFPEKSLNFSNNINTLQEEIKTKFPEEFTAFQRFRQAIRDFDSISLDNTYSSATNIIKNYIKNPKLVNMLLCPVMFYGNAQEYDMDWTDFAIIWESIFESGFSRPRQGMEYITKLLLKKYSANGGEIRFNTKAVKISENSDKSLNIQLANGEVITAEQIFSSARYVETSALCGFDRSEKTGNIAFSELICHLDVEPAELGAKNSIIFYSENNEFIYKKAEDFIDCSSGVICLPNNFAYQEKLPEGIVRVAVKANYRKWADLTTEEYQHEKKNAIESIINTINKYLPEINKHLIFTDLFTPLTITRYTGHLGGSIYGSAHKVRDARMDFENLFLIGTDQGYLGIVGALLSGISIINKYGL